MADAKQHIPTRDEIRAGILSGNHKPRSVFIQFFGQEIEVRQMLVENMHDLAAGGEVGEQEAVIRILLNMSYVPGTDQRVFEAADYEVLKKLPYGPDMNRVAEALKTLTDANLT